ncbi:hypothetical protein P3T27_006876 [Kitasatospora sp. MAA19]|uniref:hypothetical protein n=1 Tax=Kitasatospora sp. MAA19 TaxID=3035090 RepID=UPI00247486E5|nr:hypothetical protein [Kitasatospora sp. MAA19]MDH6710127.1 hypothetical protein [Kitasatospora sp. MAA19]
MTPLPAEPEREEGADLTELLRTGIEAAERYRREGAEDDGDTADHCLRQALDLAARENPSAVPACLSEIAAFDLAIHERLGGREALADAYRLMIEAFLRSRSADGNEEFRERTDLVLRTVHGALDPTVLEDADWFIALNRQLLARLGEQAIVLQELSIASSWKAQITQAEPDILAMAEAAEQAAVWYDEGPAPAFVLRAAADGWHTLGSRQRNPDLIRKGIIYWQRLADQVDTASVGDLAELALALLQVHYEAPEDSLRREALERLGQLRALEEQEGGEDDRLGAVAGMIIWVLHWEYTRDQDMGHFDEAIDFGEWCLERIPASHPSRPGLMNDLADCYWARYGDSRRSAEYDRAHELSCLVLELVSPGSPEYQKADERMPLVIQTQRGMKSGGLGDLSVIAAIGDVHTFGGPIRLPVAEWTASGTSPVACRMTSRFASALTNAPGTQTGPAPQVIPARTHAVEVVIEAPQHSEVAIVALRTVVEARKPMTIADSMLCRPGPLDVHFDVDLDEEPPTVRTADGSDLDVRSRGTLPRGAKGLFTLVARTRSWDITWRLQVDWKCGQLSGVFTSPQLRTTGETGWRRFDPAGKAEPADPSLPGATY